MNTIIFISQQKDSNLKLVTVGEMTKIMTTYQLMKSYDMLRKYFR